MILFFPSLYFLYFLFTFHFEKFVVIILERGLKCFVIFYVDFYIFLFFCLDTFRYFVYYISEDLLIHLIRLNKCVLNER